MPSIFAYNVEQDSHEFLLALLQRIDHENDGTITELLKVIFINQFSSLNMAKLFRKKMLVKLVLVVDLCIPIY